jgi:hypothetical protein
MNKPSHLTRRKTYPKIADISQSRFTETNRDYILCSSCRSKAGIRTPNKATKGHNQTWFFCTHQKHSSILLWWEVLSGPLNGWPDLAGSSNLILPATQRLEPMGGGLTLLQGIPQ